MQFVFKTLYLFSQCIYPLANCCIMTSILNPLVTIHHMETKLCALFPRESEYRPESITGRTETLVLFLNPWGLINRARTAKMSYSYRLFQQSFDASWETAWILVYFDDVNQYLKRLTVAPMLRDWLYYKLKLSSSLSKSHSSKFTNLSHTHIHTEQRRATGPLLCPALRVCAMMAGDDWLPDHTLQNRHARQSQAGHRGLKGQKEKSYCLEKESNNSQF